MSSAISDVRRSRSSREMPGLAGEMSADVGDDAVAERDEVDRLAGELWAELADDEHVDLVLEVGERFLDRWRDGRLIRDETLVELHCCYFLLRRNNPRRPLGGAARDRLGGPLGATGEDRRQLVERGGGIGLGARERHRDALVDRTWDLAIGRDEDVRFLAEDGDDVVVADADARVRAIQHELDLRLVVVHQLQGLEPELRVLE